MKLLNAERDARSLVVTEWSTTADRGQLYWALTEGLSDWLGEPTSINLVVEPGVAFCIAVSREQGGSVHYGRFVELRPDRRVVMKWISESLGGIESDVVIDLHPTAAGTDVTVTHAGVTDERVRADVADLWHRARHALDALIVSSKPPR